MSVIDWDATAVEMIVAAVIFLVLLKIIIFFTD